jgi:hypothetical protein
VTNTVLEEALARTRCSTPTATTRGYRFPADEARGAGLSWPTGPRGGSARDNRWWSVFGKRRGKTKKADPPVHDDLVRRSFIAHRPNRLWLAGITEHATEYSRRRVTMQST